MWLSGRTAPGHPDSLGPSSVDEGKGSIHERITINRSRHKESRRKDEYPDWAAVTYQAFFHGQRADGFGVGRRETCIFAEMLPETFDSARCSIRLMTTVKERHGQVVRMPRASTTPSGAGEVSPAWLNAACRRPLPCKLAHQRPLPRGARCSATSSMK